MNQRRYIAKGRLVVRLVNNAHLVIVPTIYSTHSFLSLALLQTLPGLEWAVWWWEAARATTGVCSCYPPATHHFGSGFRVQCLGSTTSCLEMSTSWICKTVPHSRFIAIIAHVARWSCCCCVPKPLNLLPWRCLDIVNVIWVMKRVTAPSDPVPSLGWGGEGHVVEGLRHTRHGYHYSYVTGWLSSENLRWPGISI
jgi:hypothetical protein